jgi:phage shock protein E
MELINKFKTYWVIIGMVFVGLAAGYLYWHYIGCLSGTCVITSSPVNSTIYGGIMGGLLGNIFQSDKKTIKE